MPEHRATTPPDLRDLESFLWFDFTELAVWADWLAVRDYPARWGPAAFDDALALQRALRALQISNNNGRPAEEALHTLNDLLQRSRMTPAIDAEQGLQFTPHDQGPIGRLLQLFLLAVQRAQWPRFKLCRDATCRASYYDSSKNASMTWCSMQTCGSRAKMRRFRSKPAS